MKNNIKTLKETDQYALLMFVLYKMTGVKEYSAISELAYTLDKQNFFNLCSIFGGRTIRIPTVTEMLSLANIMLLYQYVNIDGMSYDSAVKAIGFRSSELRNVKSIYLQVCKVLKDYSFSGVKDAE